MDNKEELEQKNAQDDNKTKSDKKLEEIKETAQEENNEKSIDENAKKEEKVNNKQMEEEKENNDKEKDEQITQRNEVINKFLEQMEIKSNKDDVSSKNIRNKEEESDDPFLKAENEYRKKTDKKQNNIEEENKMAKSENKYSHNLRYQTKKETEKVNKRSSGVNIKKLKEKKLTINIIYNHFKNNVKSKKTEVKCSFRPIIYKNPENLYLKAIQDSELNHLKLKSYNRRTGMFDLKLYNMKKNMYLNKNQNFFNTRTSFNTTSHNYYDYNITSAENRIMNYKDYIKYNNTNNTINNNYNRLSKKNMYLNNEALNTINANCNEEILSNKENNVFYTSVSEHSHLTDKNHLINHKNKIENKEYILSNNLPEDKNETKSENLIKENKKRKISHSINKDNCKAYSANTNRIFCAQKSKNKYTLLSSKTTKNKNSKYLMDKLLYSMNDPCNPYSINFSRKLLKNMFNMDIKYKKFELGVPLLSIQNSGRYSKLKFSEKPKERMIKTSYNNFPSGFKSFYSNKNGNKGNKRYFTMSHTGKNFYKK